jgi:hypothetical protein
MIAVASTRANFTTKFLWSRSKSERIEESEREELREARAKEVREERGFAQDRRCGHVSVLWRLAR